jgi:hypothetical protein
VVQQVVGEFQCLERSLNAYLDMCLDIIASFAELQIQHILRHENYKANMLAQQASGFDIGGRNFSIKEKPLQINLLYYVLSKSVRLVSKVRPSMAARPATRLGQFRKAARPTFSRMLKFDLFQAPAMVWPIWMVRGLPY